MADKTGNADAKDCHLGVPFQGDGSFYVKGAGACGWGMKNRLARIFNPQSGNTVMLAFDHGYIMGATSGLERLDIAIPPLIPHADVLMATRGSVNACISPAVDKPICLRISYDSSVLHEDMSGGGGIACDIVNAVRMNATAMAVQVFVGAPGEKNSLEILARTVDAGTTHGIPTLGVVALGRQMERTEKFFLLAVRLLAENGAQFVKAYYCAGFERVTAACPVPVVIAGGRKLPEAEALTMAYRAVGEGARGVDMGRNIFQAADPAAMCRAVAKIVHEGYTDVRAAEYYEELRRGKQSREKSGEKRGEEI
jgi:putative autoinducer-2 (AI-2) aldolase